MGDFRRRRVGEERKRAEAIVRRWLNSGRVTSGPEEVERLERRREIM